MDGKKIADRVLENVNSEIKCSGLAPRLAIVLVGKDPASQVYVGLKGKACEKVGIVSKNYELPESTSERELIALIKKLNSGQEDGILVQLPLPKHINERKVLLQVDPAKDVDGIHPANLGALLAGEPTLIPCTPFGIIELLDSYGIAIGGKEAVVIGRSNIVGKPVSVLLTERNATVTVCHSKTKGLGSHTRRADILVVAVGKPNLIKVGMVKAGAVVIDVGTNRVGGKLVGDVDFENVRKKAGFITPVPGGVGPMTVAMLMKNTLSACISRRGGK